VDYTDASQDTFTGVAMRPDEIRRHSRWMMRAQEWDEPRARYPNVWHEGMPRHVLAFTTVVSRMRLGDLVAVYYPASQRHRERSERFLGLSRVVALRRAHDPAFAWLDLETAWRFDPPVDAGTSPRRVFLCCDAGWPEPDVALFRKVFDAAVAAGWNPTPEERIEASVSGPAPTAVPPEPEAAEAIVERDEAPLEDEVEPREPQARGTATVAVDASGRLFAGAALCGDMRDPREGSWLAIAVLRGDRLEVVRLEATGRAGLHGRLRDPDAVLMRTEGVGLAFPFSVPLDFAESLMAAPFPEEGWWALARHIERTRLPSYLVALAEFRQSRGELSRYTDEAAGAPSPLTRSGPDLGSMAYHGIKMIAEERSRYAIRPFESAQGRLLLEVYPAGALRRLTTGDGGGTDGRDRRAALGALARAPQWPVVVAGLAARQCLARPEALDAVLAARSSAVAILSGETERSPEELAGEAASRVRREGWIYGLGPC
jgi:hypothetical protein